MSAVVFQQSVSLLGTPSAGSIVREAARWQRLPDIKNRADDSPTSLHHVRTLEQRGVADHAIMEQTFVPGGGLFAEIVRVLKIHVNRSQPHDRSRGLGGEAQRDSFLGLDMKHQLIRHEILYSGF